MDEPVDEAGVPYAQILEAVPGGVVHVGADGAIALANTPAQEFLGLSYDALSKRFVVDFEGETFNEDGTICPVEDYPVARCLTTGQKQPPRTIGVRQPTGEIAWAVFTALPIEGGGAVVSFMDITAHKRAEEKVRVLQVELAQRERLATVGTIAASVAHEVNNPLAYIMLSLESALQSIDTLGTSQGIGHGPRLIRELHEAVSNAMEGSDRVGSIIQDLKTFSTVGDDEESICAINSSVEMALRMAHPALRYLVTVECDLGNVPAVKGGSGRLAQIFLNLLLNAAAAFDVQDLANRVWVRSFQRDDRVVVTIRDNGCGMDVAETQRAFEPFYTNRGGGMGLGLAICRSLIDALDGGIEVRSTLGKGTTFTVDFPAQELQQQAATSESTLIAPPEQRFRVLVVDDEPLVRRLLARYLNHTYDTDSAGSVREALHALETNTFDAVVCDTMLLDGTGGSLYRWAQENRPGLEAKFLFISGGTFTPQVEAFLDDENPPLMYKPFRGDDLVRGLNILLEA